MSTNGMNMNGMLRTKAYTAPHRRGFQGYGTRSGGNNMRIGNISNRAANRFIRQMDIYERDYPALTTNISQNKVNYQGNSWRDVITKRKIDNIVINKSGLNDIPFKDNSEPAKVIPFNYNTLKNSMGVDSNEMDSNEMDSNDMDSNDMDSNEMDSNDYTYAIDLGCDDWGGDWEYESVCSDDDNYIDYDNGYGSDGYSSGN